nr:immunoglobulin heavy chain junction region [Mus musculus]MBK4198171.1 immunoglobulin heavy chain junction region [Mus musculus]MBK4198172.1 immunoglobulin heavy chain junction region [Mus musculus]MBK4198173.1 immunoglobulin heavy chain junction region [Mus musculus]MBK4198178.1 immunoglobulin heavy chain junction region [Mus musculus]
CARKGFYYYGSDWYFDVW